MDHQRASTMSRTTALKIGYVIALAVLAAGCGILIWATGGDRVVLLVLLVVLLLPGRILGYFYRDHFRGCRLFTDGVPLQSLDYLHQFLDQIRKRPWQKSLLWLSWSFYTTDVEARS
jgi:hypothetical protein